ncbi:MAG: hypothetical protein ACO239_06970 [Sediminibacterium sp.]
MKDTFDIHKWNLKRYLAEQLEPMINLSDLTFDKIAEVFPQQMQRDGVPFPQGGDVLIRIKREVDFEDWKSTIMNLYGDVKIKLDPDTVWYKYVEIVDDQFNKDKKSAIQSKSDFLDKSKGSKD